MKRIVTILFGLLVAVMISAQTRPVLSTYSTTLSGIEADTITLNLMTEPDYLSIQMIPTHGATLTDSMDFSHQPYMRNTYTGVWSRIAVADTVSGTTAALVSADTDAYHVYSPFKYLQLRYILTGISTDTVLVTIRAVQK
jgi:hypothetical protein